MNSLANLKCDLKDKKDVKIMKEDVDRAHQRDQQIDEGVQLLNEQAIQLTKTYKQSTQNIGIDERESCSLLEFTLTSRQRHIHQSDKQKSLKKKKSLNQYQFFAKKILSEGPL